MNEQEINIAIAEFCGFINQGKAKGVPALNYRWFNDKKFCNEVDLPNYYHDLNAMREAWILLTSTAHRIATRFLIAIVLRDSRQVSFQTMILQDMITIDTVVEITNATSKQYGEALLRTIGKWKD